MKKLKWTTEVHYVDIDTGELITNGIEHTHIKINQKIKYTVYESLNKGIRTIINECRRRERDLAKQSSLF